MKSALEYSLRPLVSLLEDQTHGQQLYEYLYFERGGVEKRIISALKGRHNIIVVGNPGIGKTTLMHYMFIDFKKENQYYPIILDFRDVAVRKPQAVLLKFCIEMINYFKEIGRNINITEATTLENCENQAFVIKSHLEKCSLEDTDKKKIVIFIDDLDYAENDFMIILKDYFIPYMHTDKACVVLSVRPTLYNTIQSFDALRQYYYTFPREIRIDEDDLEYIIHSRLKAIINEKEKESLLSKFLKVFKKKTYDDIIIEKIKKIDPDFKELDFTLPFNETFYAKMRDITFFNLRNIEEILPDLIEYRIASNDTFDDTFYDIFIDQNKQKRHILQDIVSHKTYNVKPKLNNNSIYQIVLEYFYFEKMVNKRFYNTMKEFGIETDDADEALNTLSRTPYSMLIPEFLYELDEFENRNIIKAFEISIKGIKYIENILINDKYYSQLDLKQSNRSLYKEKTNYV